MKKGWEGEPTRHAMSRYGIKTGNKKILVSVQPVKKFNVDAERRWDKSVDEWRESGGYSQPNPMPFVGLFKFYKNDGSERKTGYVARYRYPNSDRTGSLWAKTKKEAIERVEKE